MRLSRARAPAFRPSAAAGFAWEERPRQAPGALRQAAPGVAEPARRSGAAGEGLIATFAPCLPPTAVDPVEMICNVGGDELRASTVAGGAGAPGADATRGSAPHRRAA